MFQNNNIFRFEKNEKYFNKTSFVNYTLKEGVSIITKQGESYPIKLKCLVCHGYFTPNIYYYFVPLIKLSFKTNYNINKYNAQQICDTSFSFFVIFRSELYPDGQSKTILVLYETPK